MFSRAPSAISISSQSAFFFVPNCFGTDTQSSSARRVLASRSANGTSHTMDDVTDYSSEDSNGSASPRLAWSKGTASRDDEEGKDGHLWLTADGELEDNPGNHPVSLTDDFSDYQQRPDADDEQTPCTVEDDDVQPDDNAVEMDPVCIERQQPEVREGEDGVEEGMGREKGEKGEAGREDAEEGEEGEENGETEKGEDNAESDAHATPICLSSPVPNYDDNVEMAKTKKAEEELSHGLSSTPWSPSSERRSLDHHDDDSRQNMDAGDAKTTSKSFSSSACSLSSSSLMNGSCSALSADG